MKKITNREKVIISLGVLGALAILVYFFLWPMLAGKGSKSTSDLKSKQDRLQTVEKLKDMEPTLSKLEKDMRVQLGYGDLVFKRGIADSIVFKYLAQVAAQSEIKEIDQLETKPDKSKKTQTSQRSDQMIMRSITNQLYLSQISEEMKPSAAMTNPGASAPQKPVDANAPKETKKEVKSDSKESESIDKAALLFPPIPKDIPEGAKQSLVKSIETNQGQTPTNEDIDALLDTANVKDEKEIGRIRKKLTLYSDRVKEKKNDEQVLLGKLNNLQSAKMDEKLGKFSVKMSFRSDLGQLVRLLYNLQNSAKWIKIEGMQLSVADRNKGILAVELLMTATTMYEN